MNERRYLPPKGSVVVVTGGREWTDWIHATSTLAECRPGHVVVGCARGLDSTVREWCKKERVTHTVVYADWDTHGKKAGPMRSRKMLEVARRLAMNQAGPWLLYWPGGHGTRPMIQLAREAGVLVISATLDAGDAA